MQARHATTALLALVVLLAAMLAPAAAAGSSSRLRLLRQNAPSKTSSAASKGSTGRVASEPVVREPKQESLQPFDGDKKHPQPGTPEADRVEPAHADAPTRVDKPRTPRKYVCLTFDDGPNSRTTPVAEAIADVAKADFFLNCHHGQKEAWGRVNELLKLGMGIQSHMCDHATVRNPKESRHAERSWPSMKNYGYVYGGRKQHTPALKNCFKNNERLRQTLQANYGDSVRRYVKMFQDHGKTLPKDQMTLARLPGDGRFFKCLTSEIESVGLADLGHASAVSKTPYHLGWQFECASNRIKWGHLPAIDHQKVAGMRCSKNSLPRDGDIILMHEAHFSSADSRLALVNWIKMLAKKGFDVGRVNPANGKCERFVEVRE